MTLSPWWAFIVPTGLILFILLVAFAIPNPRPTPRLTSLDHTLVNALLWSTVGFSLLTTLTLATLRGVPVSPFRAALPIYAGAALVILAMHRRDHASESTPP